MTDDRWLREQIDEEWDRAEAEMLEQVNLVTELAQIREALDVAHITVSPKTAYDVREALAALDGCVLLTAEEAARVTRWVEAGVYQTADMESVTALLTPDQEAS
jgi:hypothetical protein